MIKLRVWRLGDYHPTLFSVDPKCSNMDSCKKLADGDLMTIEEKDM